MNWALAIDRNRKALLRVAAVLFAMAGLARGGATATLPRPVRCAILRLLRPAESAARRLIVIAARGLSVPRSRERPCPERIERRGDRPPSFPIVDPRKRPRMGRTVHPPGVGPRLSIPGISDPVFAPALAPDPDAGCLCRRMHALQRALEDLPRQARRLARWRARRMTIRAPLRPGRPPGYRAKPAHEIDRILSDCHALAVYAVAAPDTS